jgi:DNA ligase-1
VGLTDVLRAALWDKRKTLIGKIVKFRYQKIGTMVAPRQPIFLGFRDKADM